MLLSCISEHLSDPGNTWFNTIVDYKVHFWIMVGYAYHGLQWGHSLIRMRQMEMCVTQSDIECYYTMKNVELLNKLR